MSNSNVRFEVTPGKHKNDWDIPESVLDYEVENFEKYIKDNATEEAILDSNLIPSNIGGSLKIYANRG